MKYDSASVKKMTLEAAAASSRCWVPDRNGGDESTIEAAKNRFYLAMIDPEFGVVSVEFHIASVLNVEPGQRWVWFLTKLDDQRVFFDVEKGNFGVALGPETLTGQYLDLGIRTTDPVDAFLA